jgi:thiosulfate/3-mercaptopyruvate sulfurtransferase
MRFKKRPRHSSLLSLALAFAGSAHAERLTEQPLVDAKWLAQQSARQARPGRSSTSATLVKDGTAPYAAGHVPGSVEAQYAAYGWRAKIERRSGPAPQARRSRSKR